MMTDRLKNQAQEYLRASGVSGKMIEIIAIKKRRMFFLCFGLFDESGKDAIHSLYKSTKSD